MIDQIEETIQQSWKFISAYMQEREFKMNNSCIKVEEHPLESFLSVKLEDEFEVPEIKEEPDSLEVEEFQNVDIKREDNSFTGLFPITHHENKVSPGEANEFKEVTDCKLEVDNADTNEDFSTEDEEQNKDVFADVEPIYQMQISNRQMGVAQPFSCHICGKTVAQKRYLSSHMLIHKNVQPFSCDVCGKSFTRKFDVSRHKRIHTGGVPFSCDICRKTFSQKHHLQSHCLIHTGEIPFSCVVCGKSFTQKNMLNRHMHIHTGYLPFSCNVCSKSFLQKNHLNRHLLTHTTSTPFPCGVCGKAFTQNSQLDRHMLVHKTELAFSCDLCGTSFTQKSDLKRHMRIHTGDNPFSCQFCNKSFSRKDSLNSHLQIHASLSFEDCGKPHKEALDCQVVATPIN